MDFYEFLASYGILGFSVSTALGLSFYNIMDNIAGEIILPLIGALFGIKNLHPWKFKMEQKYKIFNT
jgi:large-conductance mechanosensitive channel